MRLLLLAGVSLCLTACAAETSRNSQPFGPSVAEYKEIVAEQFAAKSWTAKSLPELSDALAAGELSSEALTQAYLTRIASVDRAGPQLQAVLAINPDAMSQAKASDARRKAGEALGPMDGIPVMFKDNIETLDAIPTTAGSYALENNVTGRDSPLVAGLRAQGAVILAKTNLSQWANFRSNNSASGWSAMGGQVRNPHMLDRNPCGSSSGSGVATAASLAAGTVGTETNGSIICPSNVNGVVGFKPTVGLVSSKYIVPISPSQDTAGPITKTVRGAALMLDAMDNQDIDYAKELDAQSLQGKRVGVMRFSQGKNADVVGRFNAALAAMESAGATLVDIEKFTRDIENYGDTSFDFLLYEFKASLNEYLAETPAAVKTRTLKQLIDFNANDPRELALFDQSIFELTEKKGPLTEEAYLSAKANLKRATGVGGIDKMMTDYGVDMLVSPSGPIAPRFDPVNGDVWPSWAGSGNFAAVSGYPHITVPNGHVHGIPLGFSIMASKGQDAEVLSYGYAFEAAGGLRMEPQYLRSAEERPELAKVLRP